jgi:hypothetical protein
MSDWRSRIKTETPAPAEEPKQPSWRDRVKAEAPAAPASGEPRMIPDSELVTAGVGGQADALMRGAAQGASFGFADELTALVGAIKDSATSDSVDFDQAYESWKNVVRKADKKAEDEHGKTFMAGNIAGGVGTAFVPGLGALNAGKGAKLGEVAGKAALQGGLTGVGSSESDTAGGMAVDAAKGAAIGGALGAAGHGVGKGLGWLAEKGAKGAAKTLLTASEPVDKYLANPDKYNVDISVDSVARDLRPDLRRFEDSATAAADLAAKKGKVADEARAHLVRQLESVRPGTAAEDAVTTALQGQRDLTNDLAQKQMKMLEGQDTRHSLKALDELVEGGLKREAVDGVNLSGDPESAALKKLLGMLDEVRPEASQTRMGDDGLLHAAKESPALVPQDIVKLRQKIDNVIDYDVATGAHVGRGQTVSKQARGALNEILDTQLPNSPEYAAVRGKLAAETDLRGRASETFGGDNLRNVLEDIPNPRNAEKFQTLKQLDAKHKDAGVLDTIRDYLAAKGKLNNTDRLQKNLDALPQVKTAEEAEKKARLLEKLNARLEGTNADNIDKRLRSAMFSNKNNPQLQVWDGLNELARRTGKPIEELVDVLKVRGAFGKEGANGSRLVNWLANLTPGGELGKGIGASIGAGLDVKRGEAAKNILDRYLKAQPGIDTAGRVGQVGIMGALAPAAAAATDDKDGDVQFQKLLEMLNAK